MPHITTTLIASFFLFFSNSVSAKTEIYTIDPTHTYPHFAVSHLGYSTMHGRFDKTSGTLTLNRIKKNGSVDINIEAASLSTGMKKRDAHLRSPDFFNAVEFPKITYRSTTVMFNGDTPTKVEGNLTLLGITKKIILTITAFKCGKNPMNLKEMCGIDAIANMKRSDFGMNYALPGVGDDIKLTIEVEAYKN